MSKKRLLVSRFLRTKYPLTLSLTIWYEFSQLVVCSPFITWSATFLDDLEDDYCCLFIVVVLAQSGPFGLCRDKTFEFCNNIVWRDQLFYKIQRIWDFSFPPKLVALLTFGEHIFPSLNMLVLKHQLGYH